MTADLRARKIARELAARILDQSMFLLPNRYREGAEGRCGFVAGERGGKPMEQPVSIVYRSRYAWSSCSLCHAHCASAS